MRGTHPAELFSRFERKPTPRHVAHIWLSWSPDLRHWGDHTVLLRAREGGFWTHTTSD